MAQAKAAFNLDRFKAEVLGEGLARTNRFEVFIIPPPALSNYESDKFSMYCEVSNFPPLSLNVRQLRIFGPNFQRPIASDYGGDGISMTFHVDIGMRIKSFFDDWVQFIVNATDWTVQYPDNYQTNINIRQIDEQNNITYEIELLEAFPRSINIMELNNSSQSQTHRLNVIFSYRYWRKLVVPNPIPVVPVSTVPVIVPIQPNPGVQWDVGQTNELGSYSQTGGSDFALGA